MHLQILGPLEVTRDGSRITLGGPKQRLVLAHLLIRANEVVSADHLIDEIWGDEPPDAARPSLQSYVSHLRKALGPDRLEGRAPGYILHASADEIDAKAFESLAAQARRRMSTDPASAARGLHQALALWRGEPLADLAGELSLQPEIQRLSELRLAAQEDLIEAELALGRHADLVAELERLVGRHPLRERLCGQLMVALYRSGRQADALAAYHRLRSALDDELGLEPSPALEGLQRQILNHDPALDLRGEPLRGYRIVGQVAAGPLAVVHRAIDPHTEREVAIKVLGRQLANDADFVRRFDADAGRVARLEHPNVVALVDWWREPDAAYLVTRLMSGGSLSDRLTRGRVAGALALRWTEQVGAALAAAHRQGVLHGDLRPENVLFDGDENAYLTDFAVGIDHPTHLGGARSEPLDPYLAPERRSGAPPSVEADIYALGVLLGDLVRPSLDGASGPELASVLDRATSSHPAARPQDASELVVAIRQAVVASAGTDRFAASIGGPMRNPYKGLRAFEEADAPDFVGREDLVGRLLARLADTEPASRMLAIVGPSGSGKSSVLSAGVVPALRSGALPGSADWFVARMTPGHRPFEQLERALLAVAVNAPASLAELLHDVAGLRPAQERVLPEGSELLLVIDQFEELFTLTDGPGRRRFLEMLGRTLDDPGAHVRVAITLRADFYDRPLRDERFGRHLAAGTHAVPPMTAVELERAVSEPAERAGLRLEPGLVARIVAEASEQPGALPLTQYALSELWEHREGSRLSLAGYDASGGIAGAVSRRAEHLVTQLDAAGLRGARQIFLRLVEPGEGAPDTARKVRLAELEAMSTDIMTMDEVTESFARYRLLLLDRDPDTREPTVELAHEALLRAWPRLQQWVDDAREDLRQQRRLAAAAAQWIEGGRDPSFLLTGSRLEQTGAWAASTDILLGAEAREFIAASLAERHRQEEEEARRSAREAALERRGLVRLRALVVVLGLGALLAGALSVYALRESDRAERGAREARARELAAAALANLDIDPERSVLLALEAVRATREADGSVVREAEEALHRATVASRVVLTVPDEGGEVDWAMQGEGYPLAGRDRLPDGGSIFVTQGPEESGTVTIRDGATGDVILSWHGHDADVNDVAFSRDGSLLATTGDDGLLKIWRASDGGLLGQVQGEGQVWGPAFSADGTSVAAAWPEEGVVRIGDRTGGHVREVEAAPGVQAVAFSPAGAELAIGPVGEAVQVLDADSLQVVRTLVDPAIGTEIFGFEIGYGPGGRWLAATGLDSTAKVWDAASGALRYSVHGHSGPLMSLDWADYEPLLMTGSSDGTAALWEIADDGYRRVLSFASQDLPGGIAGVALLPGAFTERVLVAGNIVNTVKIYDLGLAGDAERANLGSSSYLGALAFTSDGHLALGGEDSISRWDTTSGRLLGAVKTDPEQGPILWMDASPDGSRLATTAFAGASVWDPANGREVRLSSVDEYGPIAWGDGGRTVAAARRGVADVDLFDPAGRHLRTSQGAADFDTVALDMRSDGLMAVGEHVLGRPDPGKHRVTLRDAASGQTVQTLSAPGFDGSLAFDPSGDRFALAFFDGRAEVWELTRDDRVVLAGHIGRIRDLAFSPDGTRVATAGDDGTVRIWDAHTGEPRLVLRHGAAVNGVRFLPDGSGVVSSGQDGVVRVWALALDDLITIARRNVTRQLSEVECREYLHLEACPVVSP